MRNCSIFPLRSKNVEHLRMDEGVFGFDRILFWIFCLKKIDYNRTKCRVLHLISETMKVFEMGRIDRNDTYFTGSTRRFQS